MSKEESWIISIGKLHTTIYNQDQKIADLEAKLAESENKVKGFVELFDKKQHENYEQFCENKQLKQQLAEKEEQLLKSQEMYFETLKEYDDLEDNFNNTSLELWAEKTINQDKISFAIEQLNQAKGKIQHNILFVNCDDYVNVIEELDNQIKQLKEGK